ncbi:helix-turn-helix domain-containing protein [Sphingobacterium sp. SRCM116780]|uniref:helix-turn-helix domain-containing protein n=1 Tax=Sphingobacterium sp. SRCM116780 TaxID=2907623 RepID=UPI001F1A43AC|nr:helix-turn-helix transcriptional regulator [Sphingobacterium sp. SRCM116780]UIR56938.1 helix-turn-helix domain-containing protein [Sphingobacterium sp. SRCM116780]
MPKTLIEFEIVNLVRKKRKGLKMSQAKIAALFDVSAGYIGQIEMENSSSMYSYEQLNMLALFFNCSPKEFMPEKALES